MQINKNQEVLRNKRKLSSLYLEKIQNNFEVYRRSLKLAKDCLDIVDKVSLIQYFF